MDITKKVKRKPMEREKILQTTYLVRDLYLEYMNNSSNSIIKSNQILKTEKGAGHS